MVCTPGQGRRALPKRMRATLACLAAFGFCALPAYLISGFLGSRLSAAEVKVSPKFEPDILPVFQAKCLPCHDAKTKQAGLSVQSRDELLKGGKSGAAVVPGKPVESLLLAMISSGRMPMGGSKLDSGEIEAIRRWIESGALKQGEDAADHSSKPAVHEREILASIIGAKCFVCHGRRVQNAGLDLRTRASMLKGGKSGPAIVPGKPDESLMVKRIAAQEMPPPHLQEQFSVRGLTSEEFDKLRQWISAGAPADNEIAQEVRPEADPKVSEKDRSFWSFRRPERPGVPQVHALDKVRNPIDAFLLSKLEAKNLTFAEEADRLTLMRRAYFDLTGLPPSSEEVEAYQADQSSQAYERMIDKLLGSPRYGERWARYWLDAVGYADSEGAVSADNLRPHAWRYRDYVIRSLNADKPFDQFLTEQIAGDEMFDYKAAQEYTADQMEKMVATGFWRMAPDSTYSTEQNFIPERLDTVAGQIEILGSAVMGLTVGCARCHDHKYDPIPQRDYYRLSAVLLSALDPYDWLSPSMECVGVGAKCDDNNTRYLPIPASPERREAEEHNAPIQKRIQDLQQSLEAKAAPFRRQIETEKLAKLPTQVQQDLRKALDTPAGKRNDVQRYLVGKFDGLIVKPEELEEKFEDYRKEALAIRQQIQAEKKLLKPLPRIRAMFDMGGEPTPNRILLRGEYTNPGPLVLPGPPSVLSAGLPPYKIEKPAWRTDTSGRRLALARWLTHPNHPLTARVMVNRIWQNHFRIGLVSSPGNFGKTGPAPSHPELLDWLATEFVRQGWSIKSMHRLIMASAAYRQSSRSDAMRQERDIDNVLLSRFPMRRLDADALRDSILKVAGRLDVTPFGPPDAIEVKPDGEVLAKGSKSKERRSIFLLQRRSTALSILETFDAPMLSPNCLRRAQSTVSSQALQLMNSELVRQSAQYMAGRVMDSAGDDVPKQIETTYITALGRRPTPQEIEAAQKILGDLDREWTKQLEAEKPPEPVRKKAQWLALVTLCHTVLNSAEFLYVD